MSSRLLCAAAFLALAAPTAANAVTFSFVLAGSRNASFQLDTAAPSSITPLQINFTDVPGTFDGTAGVASLINFGTTDGIFSAAALNIIAPGLGFTQFGGPAIFTGPTSAPVFATGVFNLNNPFFGGAATLTISLVDGGGSGATVPEPESWALMIAGFGLVGAFMRRRRTSAMVSSLA